MPLIGLAGFAGLPAMRFPGFAFMGRVRIPTLAIPAATAKTLLAVSRTLTAAKCPICALRHDIRGSRFGHSIR